MFLICSRVSSQHVRRHTAVASETEDANSSAEICRIVPGSVSALQVTVWTGTTAPVCLKVQHVSINTKDIDTS